MLVKLVLLALSVVAATSKPSGGDVKCVPEKSESYMVGKVVEQMKGGAIYNYEGFYSADYSIGKDAFVEVIIDSNGVVKSNLTGIRSKEAVYVVDFNKKTCKKEDGFPVERLCTNSTKLKYLSSWKLGNQMTDTYLHDLSVANRTVTATMFREKFTRATEFIVLTRNDETKIITLQFANETMGIKNPDVFKLPDFC